MKQIWHSIGIGKSCIFKCILIESVKTMSMQNERTEKYDVGLYKLIKVDI